MKESKEVVRNGYDQISYRYRDDAGQGLMSDYEEWLDEVVPSLETDSDVLELGCGCGLPVAKILAERFTYIGVDISQVQIKRARQLVPNGQFICSDMSTVRFESQQFAAIFSFYAIIHLPLEEQPTLIDRIGNWLKPGGYFMATVGYNAWTGVEEDWLGAPMYWSHADEDTYILWLKERGLELLWKRFIPEGSGGHTLLLTRRDNSSIVS